MRKDFESLKREYTQALDAVDKIRRIEAELRADADLVSKEGIKSRTATTRHDREKLFEDVKYSYSW